MERSWYSRLLMVVGALVVAAYYVAPSAIYFFAEPEVRRDKAALKARTPDWLPENRFNLGIDLQGGLHLVMGVDTEKALLDRTERVGDAIVAAFEEEGKTAKSVRADEERPILHIELNDEADWPAMKKLLERRDGWTVLSRSGAEIQFGMSDELAARIRDDSTAQVQKTLRNRIDTYGVTEPEVRRRGTNSILIQIAGLTADEEESVKEEIIGRTAQLEFKIVDDESTFFADIADGADKPESIRLEYDVFEGKDQATKRRPYLESEDKEALLNFLAKHPAPGDRVVRLQEISTNKADPKARKYATWLLERRTALTGETLVDAYPQLDQNQNNYFVSMQFDRRGAVLFERLTRQNVKRKMAIVLDQFVDSAPIIREPIAGGRASIELGGYKTQDEILADAQALSVVLKAGSLPAPVFPQEQRTVGATLGDDAVVQGKRALSVGLLAVVILMIIYYRGAGVVAFCALAANLLVLLAVLAGFNATLTLPGIAGLALTVGMAVDANIIQFERIREELRAGKVVRQAVDAGLNNAMSAIFDANVTTLLASLVLYQYGSGPIRGFATTLGFGVFINTITAVVIPRLGLEMFTKGRRVQELSI